MQFFTGLELVSNKQLCYLGVLERIENILEQWFSTFLVLRPFNTVSRIVVTPNHNVIFIPTL